MFFEGKWRSGSGGGEMLGRTGKSGMVNYCWDVTYEKRIKEKKNTIKQNKSHHLSSVWGKHLLINENWHSL